jgi:hypothetical protein
MFTQTISFRVQVLLPSHMEEWETVSQMQSEQWRLCSLQQCFLFLQNAKGERHVRFEPIEIYLELLPSKSGRPAFETFTS